MKIRTYFKRDRERENLWLTLTGYLVQLYRELHEPYHHQLSTIKDYDNLIIYQPDNMINILFYYSKYT